MKKARKRIENRISSSLRNNKGTTMMETIVAFTVLVVILLALTRIIVFSSELRMRAMDTGRIMQTFNKCLYSNELNNGTGFDKVTKEHYDSSGAKATQAGGGVKGPLFYIKPKDNNVDLWVTDINAYSYTYNETDPSVNTENLTIPKAIVFVHESDDTP